MATTLADIHPHIIQTHILPRLDGPSLSTTAMVSSHVRSFCSDHNLWADVSKSTWPSITDPRVDEVISTFPNGHRSFFQDSFSSLTIIDVVKSNSHQSDGLSCDHLASPSNLWPTELISAVEIRYQNDIIYSKVKFTDITTEFLSSELRIQLYNDPTSTVDLKIDELKCGDEATSSLLHLKEFLTLSWIIIEPARKWAVNLSSVKSVNARHDSLTKETVVQYVTILPRCGPNEMVQCKIQIVLGFGIGLVGSFYVKKVILKFQDLDSSCLNGRDFLAVTREAIMEKNNVRRKVVEDDEERWKSYKKFKEMKKEKKESIKKEERKLEFEIKMNYIAIFVTLLFNVYFLSLLLH